MPGEVNNTPINPDTGRPYGQATNRQFIRMVLKFIAYNILGRGMILAFQIAMIVLAIWSIWAMTWGIVRMCQVMGTP